MTTRLDPQNYGSPFDGIGGRDRAVPMLILDTFTIKGRGLVIVGYPAAEPLQGGTVAAPDGRRWTVAGVERFLGRRWRPEDGAGILLARGGSEPLPCKGETVMVETVAAAAESAGPRTFDRVAVYVDGHRLRENEAMDLTARSDGTWDAVTGTRG